MPRNEKQVPKYLPVKVKNRKTGKASMTKANTLDVNNLLSNVKYKNPELMTGFVSSHPAARAIRGGAKSQIILDKRKNK